MLKEIKYKLKNICRKQNYKKVTWQIFLKNQTNVFFNRNESYNNWNLKFSKWIS